MGKLFQGTAGVGDGDECPSGFVGVTAGCDPVIEQFEGGEGFNRAARFGRNDKAGVLVPVVRPEYGWHQRR